MSKQIKTKVRPEYNPVNQQLLNFFTLCFHLNRMWVFIGTNILWNEKETVKQNQLNQFYSLKKKKFNLTNSAISSLSQSIN